MAEVTNPLPTRINLSNPTDLTAAERNHVFRKRANAAFEKIKEPAQPAEFDFGAKSIMIGGRQVDMSYQIGNEGRTVAIFASNARKIGLANKPISLRLNGFKSIPFDSAERLVRCFLDNFPKGIEIEFA